MTAPLEGGEWSAARTGRTLPPGKTRYPFYMRLGGPQGRSGRAENLVRTGIRSRTVQPVVTRYTDWATGHTLIYVKQSILKKDTIFFILHPAFYFLNWKLCSNTEVRFSFLSLLVFILKVYGKDQTGGKETTGET